jgi:hypothetical protein
MAKAWPKLAPLSLGDKFGCRGRSVITCHNEGTSSTVRELREPEGASHRPRCHCRGSYLF